MIDLQLPIIEILDEQQRGRCSSKKTVSKHLLRESVLIGRSALYRSAPYRIR